MRYPDEDFSAGMRSSLATFVAAVRTVPTRWIVFASALALLGLPGCSAVIGDGCSTALDCSINGDRTCDLARPGGACTVFGCEADSCPDGAVCVRFRPDPSRLSFTACMRSCQEDGHCRYDDGYVCTAAEELLSTPEGGDVIAEVVDEERMDDGRFCTATTPVIDND